MFRKHFKSIFSSVLVLSMLFSLLTLSAFATPLTLTDRLETVLNEKIEKNLTTNYGDNFTRGTLNKETNTITFVINPKSETKTFDEIVKTISDTGAIRAFINVMEELCTEEDSLYKSVRLTLDPHGDMPYYINYKGFRFSNFRNEYLDVSGVKAILGGSLLDQINFNVKTSTLKDFAGVKLPIRITATTIGDVATSADYILAFTLASGATNFSLNTIRNFDPGRLFA